MKSCFIILSLLLIFSINCKNEEDEKIKIDLLFTNGVAETTISIKKNITYYIYLDKESCDAQNVEFELTMENISTSPLTKFRALEHVMGIDIDRRDKYDIDLSEKQKANDLVLIGNYKSHSFWCSSNNIEFVSSCDIPNLKIKITVIVGKSAGEKVKEGISSFILTILIVFGVVVIGLVILCLVACGICCTSKRNQQIQPVYAPIQPPI